MSKIKVLVLGAGELGKAILNSLLTIPSYDLSLLVRPASSAKYASLTSSDIAIVHGELDKASVSEIADVLRPFDTVINCTGSAGSGSQVTICKAVLQAGIKRYIPWQFGVDYDAIGRGSSQDLFDEQLDVRDLLRSQSKTEWIIVSTGMFMSFLFLPVFGVVTGLDRPRITVNALASMETKVVLTAVEDIGNLTKEILISKPRIANEVVFTSGDVISYGQLADVLEKRFPKKEVVRNVWTLDHLRDEASKDQGDMMKKYRAVFAAGTGVSWNMDKTFNARKGIPVTTVGEYVKSNF